MTTKTRHDSTRDRALHRLRGRDNTIRDDSVATPPLQRRRRPPVTPAILLQNTCFHCSKIVWPASQDIPIASEKFLRTANFVRVPGMASFRMQSHGPETPTPPNESSHVSMGPISEVLMPLRSSLYGVVRLEGLGQQSRRP